MGYLCTTLSSLLKFCNSHVHLYTEISILHFFALLLSTGWTLMHVYHPSTRPEELWVWSPRYPLFSSASWLIAPEGLLSSFTTRWKSVSPGYLYPLPLRRGGWVITPAYLGAISQSLSQAQQNFNFHIHIHFVSGLQSNPISFTINMKIFSLRIQKWKWIP